MRRLSMKPLQAVPRHSNPKTSSREGGLSQSSYGNRFRNVFHTGAPERILDCCSTYLNDKGEVSVMSTVHCILVALYVIVGNVYMPYRWNQLMSTSRRSSMTPTCSLEAWGRECWGQFSYIACEELPEVRLLDQRVA